MVYPLKVRFPTFGYKTIFLSPLLRFEYPEVSGTLLLTVPSLPAPTQTTVNVQVVAYLVVTRGFSSPRDDAGICRL